MVLVCVCVCVRVCCVGVQMCVSQKITKRKAHRLVKVDLQQPPHGTLQDYVRVRAQRKVVRPIGPRAYAYAVHAS